MNQIWYTAQETTIMAKTCQIHLSW